MPSQRGLLGSLGAALKWAALAAVLVAALAAAWVEAGRGLLPPAHLWGHRLVFTDGLVAEGTAAALRQLLRNEGSTRGIPTNVRDTSFYTAK